MSEPARQLLADFKKTAWQTERLYERFFEVAGKPDEMFIFASEYLDLFDESSTLFNDALSYISEGDFAQLVLAALGKLKVSPNELAESVIAYASLQCPELLHEHLELIFELNPNASSYYSEYPWRNLDKNKISIFKDKLGNSAISPEDREALLCCLFETRDQGTVEFAFNYALEHKVFEDDVLEHYLEMNGFTVRKGKIVRYCSDFVRHFIFPDGYLPEEQAVHLSKKHPTWFLKGEGRDYKFGGILEDDENNPLFHIVTFDIVPEHTPVTALEKLVLGAHVREINEFCNVFYQHGTSGYPVRIAPEKQKIEYAFDSTIREGSVKLAVTPARWQRQDWAMSNSRESLFRLGREPSWIQNAEVLTCPVCGEKMDFLMQLDSYLPDLEGGELMFGSGGICYTFWCDHCKVSGYLMQCT